MNFFFYLPLLVTKFSIRETLTELKKKIYKFLLHVWCCHSNQKRSRKMRLKLANQCCHSKQQRLPSTHPKKCAKTSESIFITQTFFFYFSPTKMSTKKKLTSKGPQKEEEDKKKTANSLLCVCLSLSLSPAG